MDCKVFLGWNRSVFVLFLGLCFPLLLLVVWVFQLSLQQKFGWDAYLFIYVVSICDRRDFFLGLIKMDEGRRHYERGLGSRSGVRSSSSTKAWQLPKGFFPIALFVVLLAYSSSIISHKPGRVLSDDWPSFLVRQPEPTLVIYVYSGSDPEYANNLRFFVREAVKVRGIASFYSHLTP